MAVPLQRAPSNWKLSYGTVAYPGAGESCHPTATPPLRGAPGTLLAAYHSPCDRRV